MKIIQLLSRIEGSGVTRYVIELNKALKSCGHNVKIIYLDPEIPNDNVWRTGQYIDNVIDKEWNDETVEYLNKADLVIINSIISKNAPKRNEWIELLQNKITTRKVIVVNDHNLAGFTSYYGDLLHNDKFWLAFDKICTFGYDAKVYTAIRKTIGEDAATSRFMQLLLPYEFTKGEWVDHKDMYDRVCYFGRHATFKDDYRLVRGCQSFWNHDYELEMRGVRPNIHVTTQQNYKYILDEKTKKPLQKVPYVRGDKYVLSTVTYWCDDGYRWRREHNAPLKDPLVDFPREKNRIYIFGAYNHEWGLDLMSKYKFGCDFFNLSHEGCYGDNWEYTIYEMVEQGTIPLLDSEAGKSIKLLNSDTKGTFYDLGLGIFIDKDLNNIEDALNKMDKLRNDTTLYNKTRNRLFDLFKQHCDPRFVAEDFISNVIN